jgi:hypothetical protein
MTQRPIWSDSVLGFLPRSQKTIGVGRSTPSLLPFIPAFQVRSFTHAPTYQGSYCVRVVIYLQPSGCYSNHATDVAHATSGFFCFCSFFFFFFFFFLNFKTKRQKPSPRYPFSFPPIFFPNPFSSSHRHMGSPPPAPA